MSTGLPPLRAWVIWVVGVVAYTFAVANRTSLAAVGADAAERFDSGASTIAMLAVFQLAVYGAAQIPVGLVLDRYGARSTIAVGMALMAVGQAMMAFAPDVAVAIAARMILGLGDATVFPAVLRLIATWHPAQRVPVMVQLTGITGHLGQIAAVAPVAALLDLTSWTVTFGAFAALGVLFTILVWLVIRNRPAHAGAHPPTVADTGATRLVTSAVDVRVGLRQSWAHPGTRLAFWTHFVTPFSGSAFVMLWGLPFLTVGEGVSVGDASLILAVYVLVGMVFGPVLGVLSSRAPHRRTILLILPTVGVQALAWLVVIAWPGPAPLGVLFALAVILGVGGPASMVAFDQARTFNPGHRLSTATGITNVGGFFSSLLAIMLIGLALDLQGAGTPESYTLDAFRLAFLTQFPLWTLGIIMILVERRNTRVRMGLRAPRARN